MDISKQVLRDSRPFRKFLLITEKPYFETHRGAWEHLCAEVKAVYPDCLWEGSTGHWHWYAMKHDQQDIVAEGIISHDGTVWHGRIKEVKN